MSLDSISFTFSFRSSVFLITQDASITPSSSRESQSDIFSSPLIFSNKPLWNVIRSVANNSRADCISASLKHFILKSCTWFALRDAGADLSSLQGGGLAKTSWGLAVVFTVNTRPPSSLLRCEQSRTSVLLSCFRFSSIPNSRKEKSSHSLTLCRTDNNVSSPWLFEERQKLHLDRFAKLRSSPC